MPGIAHVSDTHVLSTAGVEWRRMLFNKPLAGYGNLILHCGRTHRRECLLAVLAGVGADHVVVTGDLTNLALECKYEEARAPLDAAALDHPDPSVRASFNRYEIGDDGNLVSAGARVIDPPSIALQRATIPERTACR